MSTPAKIRIVQVNAFLVALNGRESWILKKQDRKSIEVLEKSLENIVESQEIRQMHYRKKINPQISLESQRTKLELSYF